MKLRKAEAFRNRPAAPLLGGSPSSPPRSAALSRRGRAHLFRPTRLAGSLPLLGSERRPPDQHLVVRPLLAVCRGRLRGPGRGASDGGAGIGGIDGDGARTVPARSRLGGGARLHPSAPGAIFR